MNIVIITLWLYIVSCHITYGYSTVCGGELVKENGSFLAARLENYKKINFTFTTLDEVKFFLATTINTTNSIRIRISVGEKSINVTDKVTEHTSSSVTGFEGNFNFSIYLQEVSLEIRDYTDKILLTHPTKDAYAPRYFIYNSDHLRQCTFDNFENITTYHYTYEEPTRATSRTTELDETTNPSDENRVSLTEVMEISTFFVDTFVNCTCLWGNLSCACINNNVSCNSSMVGQINFVPACSCTTDETTVCHMESGSFVGSDVGGGGVTGAGNDAGIVTGRGNDRNVDGDGDDYMYTIQTTKNRRNGNDTILIIDNEVLYTVETDITTEFKTAVSKINSKTTSETEKGMHDLSLSVIFLLVSTGSLIFVFVMGCICAVSGLLKKQKNYVSPVLEDGK